MNSKIADKKMTLVINNIKVKHADELMQYLEMLKKNEEGAPLQTLRKKNQS